MAFRPTPWSSRRYKIRQSEAILVVADLVSQNKNLVKFFQTRAPCCLQKTNSWNIFFNLQYPDLSDISAETQTDTHTQTRRSSICKYIYIYIYILVNPVCFVARINFLIPMFAVISQIHVSCSRRKFVSQKLFSKSHYTDLSEKSEISSPQLKYVALSEVQNSLRIAISGGHIFSFTKNFMSKFSELTTHAMCKKKLSWNDLLKVTIYEFVKKMRKFLR